MLWFLWKDNGKRAERGLMGQVAQALGEASPFSEEPDRLFETAESHLHAFAGGQGRYRYAKAVEAGEKASAVLAMAPRYENTAMILQMQGISQHCKAPFFEISLDGDWDENSWSRLRSFLYYC